MKGSPSDGCSCCPRFSNGIDCKCAVKSACRSSAFGSRSTMEASTPRRLRYLSRIPASSELLAAARGWSFTRDADSVNAAVTGTKHSHATMIGSNWIAIPNLGQHCRISKVT